MKKTIISIFICAILLATCALPACTENDVAQEEVTSVTVSAQMLKTEYLFAPEETESENSLHVVDAYYDDTDYYYCISLGTVLNVPLGDPEIIEYQANQVAFRRECTLTKITTRSVETSMSKVVSRLTYDDHVAGFNFSVEHEAGVAELFSNKVGLSLGMQFNSDTQTTTTSSTNTNKEETTLSESQTIELTFDRSCAPGTYRISRAKDYNVYAYAKKNIESGQIAIEYKAVPIDGFITLIEYTENDRLPNNSKRISDFEFDPQLINTLSAPTKAYPDTPKTDVIDYAPATLELKSTTDSVDVKDDSKDSYLEFDLSEVKEILRNHEGSKIVKISLSLYITEIDDGYQEVYLTNQSSPSYNWKDYTHQFSGDVLLYPKDDIETVAGKKGSGTFAADFKVNLTLLDLADKFYLFCGANGKKEDSWTASNAKITLTFAY